LKAPLQAFIAFVTLVLSSVGCHQGLKSDMPVVELNMDGYKVLVEVANTEATRMAGLMFRKDMGTDNGMLFVFSDTKSRAFWMKNTEIPLSIAFADETGKIENILEMPPETEQSFMSVGAARYALEMNAGWFTKHNVKAGDMIGAAEKAPAAKD
jgi:uncharacterized protein